MFFIPTILPFFRYSNSQERGKQWRFASEKTANHGFWLTMNIGYGGYAAWTKVHNILLILFQALYGP